MKRRQTVGAAARELGVSEATVRRYCDLGQLPAERDSSNRRLIDPEDVARLKRVREAAQAAPK